MSRWFLGLAAAAALFTLPAGAATAGDRSGMSPGTRYDGPYYSRVQVQAGVPAACRDTCRGDLRCYAWNYRQPGAGEAVADCELLETVPTLVWDDQYITGEVARAQPAPDDDEVVIPRTPDGSGAGTGDTSGDDFWAQYAIQNGAEASGSAYATWTYLGKGDGGVTRCATACAGDKKCGGFVVRSDAELAPKPQVMCELKTSPGQILRNPDAVTGLKR